MQSNFNRLCWRFSAKAVKVSSYAAYLDTEKSFRRIMGYRDRWIMKAVLDEDKNTEEVMVA